MGGDIPTPVPGLSVNLGYSYMRYWSDERAWVTTNGSLYYPTGSADPNAMDQIAYDTYSLLDSQLGIVDNPEPEKVMGGTFPDYDNYLVTAQGIAGTMHPYILQQNLYRQNKKDKDGNYSVKQYPLSVRNQKVAFRFTNDFSNTFRSDGPSWNENGDIILPESTENDGYKNNHLAGSKHIEWFTNNQINNGEAKINGFIDCRASGFVRQISSGLETQIGGYTITNESGVNYHYALPAYSYDEVVYTENIEKGKGHTYNRLKKPTKYAYTWYLTAMTGPDFVDRNGNGLADEGDWGYWVSFEYGLWADKYQWRNPSEGFHQDLDKNFQSYSYGKKELYYLDAIQTRSHTALFLKSVRNDGKGLVITENVRTDGIVESKSSLMPMPQQEECCCDGSCDNYYLYPTSALKLDQIYLLKNEQLSSFLSQQKLDNLHKIKTTGDDYNHNLVYAESCSNYYEHCKVKFEQHPHTADNVLDKGDFTNSSYTSLENNLKGQSLRIIAFDSDYSLCPNTANSYSNEGIYQTDPQLPTKLSAKLTLNSIKFLGKGGSDVLPPMHFDYNLSSEAKKTGSDKIYQDNGNGHYSMQDFSSDLQKGDIITFQSNGGTCYAVVVAKWFKPEDSVDQVEIKIIGNHQPSLEKISWYTTKNPPYHKDYYDMWGMYKSDYTALEDNENLSRTVTQTSAKSVDIWSLRTIITALGAKIKINYEADSYVKPVLDKMNQLMIQKLTPKNDHLVQIDFYNTPDLKTLFTDNSSNSINLLTAIGQTYVQFSTYDMNDPNYVEMPDCIVEVLNYKPIIRKVESDYLIVESTDLYNKLTVKKPDQPKAGLYYYDIIFFGGNAGYDNTHVLQGGGLRVTSIDIENDLGLSKSSTRYNYNNSNNQSSGVTSFEPSGLDNYKLTFPEGDWSSERKIKWEHFIYKAKKEETDKKYRKELYKLFSPLLANAREVPPPGVMYEYVTIEEYVQQAGEAEARKVPGKKMYQFEVFNEGMLGIQAEDEVHLANSNGTVSGIGYAETVTRKVALKNYTTRIGNIRRVTHFNEQGNKLSETEHHYLHDELRPSAQENVTQEVNFSKYEDLLKPYAYQGVVHESFGDARLVRQEDGKYKLLAVLSKREEYPNVLTRTSTYDYKTGLREESQTLAFDFYSGAATKVLSSDSYGNRYLSENEPAYHHYDGMGLKVINPANKHMLTQTAASYIYKSDEKSKQVGLLSASVQTWSDGVAVIGLDQKQSGIWRKQASFVWNGGQALNTDGTYPIEDFKENSFNWKSPEANVSWEKTGELTLYDVFSHGLEAKDLNGNFAATRMDKDQKYVIATASPASYQEIACSGAEYYAGNTEDEGGVNRGEGNASTAHAHTGKNSLLVGFNSKGFNYTLEAGKADLSKKYRASVWLYVPGEGEIQAELDKIELYYSVNGHIRGKVHPVLQKSKSKNWYLLNITITPEGTGKIYIGCKNNASRGVYFDDFRVHPLHAAMVSYVYDPFSGELNYMLDANNFYTRFEYDAMGRLIRSSKELLNFDFGDGKESFRADKILGEVKYNYGRNNK